ncbi:transposase [Flavobacterium aquiphilum]|uniref:transposase n=1 Tax=Flavobacterium aquiphilum TaxID=3003261 RepID=UPI003D790537
MKASNNLNGLTQAIKEVFPESQTQFCAVYQTCNSTPYVVWKDKKEFSRDMKQIYDTPTEGSAKVSFENFANKRTRSQC